MTNLSAEQASPNTASAHAFDSTSFVTFFVAGQLLGVPVIRVQDILTPDAIAPVPGGPAEVCGLINLRGRIVTVIDMRVRLSLPERDEGHQNGMCVTIDHEGDAYTLFVDSVGDVITLASGTREDVPPTLDAIWRDVAQAVYRTDNGLLAALDVDRLLTIRSKQ